MREVIESRAVIAEIAPRHVLSRRSWAVVGNGPNGIAARELRIKLSELCYKAIACDATEDKKHIDLSSEPLTLVCAAGLSGSNIDDVGKEVAIYRAHRGVPLVIASEGSGGRFGAAAEVISVPAIHPALDFLMSTVAGHLFCYEAALAIDATARPLREARAAVEASAAGPVEALLVRLAPAIEGPARRFLEGLRGRPLRRHARGEHRRAYRVDPALRHRHQPARCVRTRARQGRHAEHRGAGPHLRPDPRDRRAHPADRRDQAPGQDRHRRNLALRRNAAARPSRSRDPYRRCPARRPQLPHAAHAGRARRGSRGSHRVHALPHRG